MRKKDKLRSELPASMKGILRQIHHDLRTPLLGINSLLERIALRESDSENKKILALTLLASQQLSELLANIFSELEHHQSKPQSTENHFNIKNLIEDVINLELPAAVAKNLVLKTKIDPKIPPLLIGDKSKLERILINLISNSIKFTAQGEITISALVIKKARNQIILKICIKDTGIGMPKINRDFILQESANRTATGLGLKIVKQFVNKLGGDISVRIIKTHGTIVTCSLPFKFLSTIASKPITKRKSSPASILLIDDDAITQLITKDLLNQLNYVVDIAKTGAEGIALSQNRRYQLILIDICLPDQSGILVCKEIKTTLNRNTPIIGLTALNDFVTDQQIKKVGIIQVLSKPITEYDLQWITKVCLKSNHSHNQKTIDSNFKDRVQMILELFLQSLAVELPIIEKYFRNQKYEDLKLAIHKLHGAVSFCGVPRLKLAFKNFESALNLKRKNLAKCYERLKSEISLVKSEHKLYN